LIVQGFFMPINYRGLAVEHPQISCHFSLPTILSARNSVGRSAIPLVSVEINIFLRTSDDENVSRNITYRDQFSWVSTSKTVLRLKGANEGFAQAAVAAGHQCYRAFDFHTWACSNHLNAYPLK